MGAGEIGQARTSRFRSYHRSRAGRSTSIRTVGSTLGQDALLSRRFPACRTKRRDKPMTARAHIVLEDGSVFAGRAFGATADAHGEVVFSTAMTGYQEALTDPSFAGQILVMTYPLQGNYGVNDFDTESRRVQVRGFIVREACALPSHWRSRSTL